MKAVIVNTKSRAAAALSADGLVIKIKNSNYEIGQVIEINKKQSHKTRMLVVRAAAAAAVIALCSASALAYYTPYSYVSLDVNPSFEYTLNYFDIVLSARSLSDELLLNSTELNMLNNKNIRQAVTETVEQIVEAGYFNEGAENDILIAVSSKNEKKADRLAESLQQSVKTGTEDNENIEINTSNISKELVKEAGDLGVSAGKLGLVEDLQESAKEVEIDREEWLQKPVKEIMDAIKENKNDKGNGQSHNNGSNNGNNGQSHNNGSNNGNNGQSHDNESNNDNNGQSHDKTGNNKNGS
ncbi:MAG: hypothetical protein GXY20_10085 [Clostridiales bacterium]|nr:hypothetical protein [Clostridiales bacterium]